MSQEANMKPGTSCCRFDDDESVSSEDFQSLDCDMEDDRPQICTISSDEFTLSVKRKQLEEIVEKKFDNSQQIIKQLQAKLSQVQRQRDFAREEKRKLSLINHNQSIKIEKLKSRNAELASEIVTLQKQQLFIRNAAETAQLQNEEFIVKISCLQERNELVREQYLCQMRQLQQIVEILLETQVDLENLGKVKKLSTLYSKKARYVFDKIDELFTSRNEQKTIRKQAMPVLQMLDDKARKMDKIHQILQKQQTKLIAQKQALIELSQEIQDYKQSKGTLSKWFDPVMKFCKLEEDKSAFNANRNKNRKEAL